MYVKCGNYPYHPTTTLLHIFCIRFNFADGPLWRKSSKVWCMFWDVLCWENDFFLFAALVGFIFCNCSLSAYLTGLKMGKTRGFYSFGAYWIQTVCLWPCSTSFCCHIQVFTMSSGYYPKYLFCNSFSTTSHPLPQIRCIIEIRIFKI